MTTQNETDFDHEMKRVADELADRIVRGHPGIKYKRQNYIKESDPRRKNLVIVLKDVDGTPQTWFYGPYMIGRNMKPTWGDASLIQDVDLFGHAVYDRLPNEIDSMPMAMLLDRIDQLVTKMKKQLERENLLPADK